MTGCNAPPLRARLAAMNPSRFIQAASAAALLLAGSAANAEVQKFADPSCAAQQICVYYQLALTPPDGWAVDHDATRKSKVQMIVPKGTTFATAPALIYVQVFYHPNKQQTLADFARTSNARWLAENKGAKISPLADVARTNGKGGFLRFAFDNPAKPQQAHEVGAFGIDSDKDGNEFVLDVVLTGGARKTIEAADKDYVGFLKAH